MFDFVLCIVCPSQHFFTQYRGNILGSNQYKEVRIVNKYMLLWKYEMQYMIRSSSMFTPKCINGMRFVIMGRSYIPI